MVRLDGGGRIVAVNRFLAELLQYPGAELRGRLLSDLGSAPWASESALAMVRLGVYEHLRRRELMLMSRDGLCFSFEFHEVGKVSGDRLIECLFQQLEPLPRRLPESEPPPTGSGVQRIVSPPRFLQIVQRALDRTREHRRPLSLMRIHIDRVGDPGLPEPAWTPLVLRGFAKACAQRLRQSDIVCRFDGTRFAVLLIDVATSGALCAAERLRTAVARDASPAAMGYARRIGLSIGVVSTRTGRISCAALLSRAQAKCDEAREQGGNRVVA